MRYRYALLLGRRGELTEFHRLYEHHYRKSGVASLDCLSVQADIEAGRSEKVRARGLDLWLVGRSQVDECDAVFDYLRDNGLIGRAEHVQRFDLAVENREFRLARWLGKAIDEAHVDTAVRWMAAQSNPERFLATHDQRRDSATHREQLAYAAERLTYRDTHVAAHHWDIVEPRYAFTEEQRLRIRRHIALWAARDNLPDGYRRLVALPVAARDDEVMRWRARTSLREQQWQRLLGDIDAMTPPLQDRQEWQYWRAVALQRLGQPAEARAVFERLSKDRSYYGFLAADELGRPYALDQQPLVADESLLATVAALPDIVRARELFFVGLEGNGRSEWDTAVRSLPDEEKRQAAILAHRWGWHSRAIAVAASLGEYGDLTMRYPLPWQEQFELSASDASIDPTWAYGIARSESLFMRDVRSGAGAVGVMQLLPATGKQVAREIKAPYAGIATLTDPLANIRLGTSYLGQMVQRFGGNRVLATAAYNAGPHRIDEWLPQDGSVDARAWIETIPFNETRKYVKRVLTAQTIFHWRLTGDALRLSDNLPPVAAAEDVRLAAR
ncbi:MAG: transglycosylase SLT domain-containing protein [Woeseiaceae bacterium]